MMVSFDCHIILLRFCRLTIYFAGLVKKDKNYRRYASGIERVLSSFETTVDEWADYISFLGRLLKVCLYTPSWN